MPASPENFPSRKTISRGTYDRMGKQVGCVKDYPELLNQDPEC
jgi:hypothetical protein